MTLTTGSSSPRLGRRPWYCRSACPRCGNTLTSQDPLLCATCTRRARDEHRRGAQTTHTTTGDSMERGPGTCPEATQHKNRSCPGTLQSKGLGPLNLKARRARKRNCTAKENEGKAAGRPGAGSLFRHEIGRQLNGNQRRLQGNRRRRKGNPQRLEGNRLQLEGNRQRFWGGNRRRLEGTDGGWRVSDCSWRVTDGGFGGVTDGGWRVQTAVGGYPTAVGGKPMAVGGRLYSTKKINACLPTKPCTGA